MKNPRSRPEREPRTSPFAEPPAATEHRGAMADAGLRREGWRLRRAFAAILVALSPAPLLQACGQAGTPGGGGATTTAGPEAGADAPAAADGDAAEDRDCTTKVLAVDAAADVEPICSYILPCGLAGGLVTVGCDVYVGTSPLGCTIAPDSGCVADAYSPPPEGTVLITCPGCLSGSGRKPRGLLPARAAGAPTRLGAYFARMAHEEAAAVHAFRRMDAELAAHGAPAPLRRAAERSARDEERHARVMARWARSHGAPVAVPRVRSPARRSLEAMARENAVEGCVHETFGALVLAWQAAHAPSAALRRTFDRLAADEARHAALSWAVAGWAEARLDPAARARVAAARGRAARELRQRRGASSLDAALGRPHPTQQATLVDGLLRQLGLG